MEAVVAAEVTTVVEAVVAVGEAVGAEEVVEENLNQPH
jgi:hypothetical protein